MSYDYDGGDMQMAAALGLAIGALVAGLIVGYAVDDETVVKRFDAACDAARTRSAIALYALGTSAAPEAPASVTQAAGVAQTLELAEWIRACNPNGGAESAAALVKLTAPPADVEKIRSILVNFAREK